MRNKIKIVLLALLLLTLAEPVAAAETNCTVEPFSIQMYQGDSAEVSLIAQSLDLSLPFEITLGNLPTSVEGGFSGTGSVETSASSRRIPILFQTGSDAQTGSFMISVIYKSILGGVTVESICQFNLEIKRKTGVTLSSQSIVPLVSQKISSGVLPVSIGTTTSVMKVISSATKTSPRITASLFRGSRGAQVTLLQEILQKLKFFPSSQAPTGYFGPITEGAVMVFQAAKGIESIGIVGPKTRKALSESNQ